MAGGLSYESWTDAPIGMQAAQADKIIERFRNASSQLGAAMKETPQPPPVAAPSYEEDKDQMKNEKAQVIDIVDAPNKWLRLMLHFQNSVKHTSFRCSFTDKETATKVRQRMNDVIGRRPTWFTLIVAQRDCDVYVINGSRAKPVEVRYD